MTGPRILVVVASETGRTWRMAEALVAGAVELAAEAQPVRAAEVTDAQLFAADAIVLGTGVHMAGVESPMRVFFERTAPLWLQGSLTGRLGAAFVTAGSGARGGAELTLISLHAFLAEHGLLLVPMHNRLAGYAQAGSHWGPIAWTTPRGGRAGPTEEHLTAARAHGRWIAECATRWLRGGPSPPAG